MEVKSGYKQTEVGVIPEEWSVKNLGAIGEPLIGLTYKPSNVKSDGLLVLRSSNIVNGTLRFDDNVFVDMEVPKKIIARKGDILICVRNGSRDLIGKCAKIDDRAQRMTFGAFMAVFRTPFHDFVYYQFQSEVIQRQIHEHLGATINQITNKSLKSFRIPFPEDDGEQRAIVGALGDVDALICALEKLIAKKRDLKRAATQQLLTGKTRLPGFTGEWEQKELGELGQISGSGVDKKIRPDEPPVRLINYMDVYRRSFIYSKDLNHVVSAPSEQAARCAVKRGDVFFTPSSEMPFDIAVSAVAMEDIPDAAYSYHVVRLRLDDDWDLLFRAYAFKSQEFLNQAARACEGSGVRYVITQARFRQLSVRFPSSKDEQAAIGVVLSDMDAEIAALEQRQTKTRALKQGMMQELLTGKIRLI
jgi:type I restriction enzyme S subunit